MPDITFPTTLFLRNMAAIFRAGNTSFDKFCVSLRPVKDCTEAVRDKSNKAVVELCRQHHFHMWPMLIPAKLPITPDPRIFSCLY
ncbi:MAG: hypothetical protein V4628_09345 [Pseudomonadota bacterium]